MPEKKNETKKGGLRGMFRRKESSPEAPKPSNDAETKPQEQTQRPPVRRMYTPRYAERDMILSVPVEDRPDLVAKAKENNLKRVCSDIGFSTGSSSRASSSYHTKAASLNLNALSTHPNLHISRNAAALDPATPGSSNNSIRSLSMQRYSSMPTVPLQQSANAMDMQRKGLSYNGMPSFPQRPRPRTTQSLANIPHSIPESQVEHVDYAFNNMDVSEDGNNADNDTSSRSSTPSSDYMPEIGPRPRPAPVRQRLYFSHKGPLPDLRTKKADKGKGKEQGTEWGNANAYSRPSHRASEESMSDYVISTKPLRASQTAPVFLPPPPPPSSEYGRSAQAQASANVNVDSGSSSSYTGDQTGDSRAPSLAESESYGTDHSSSCNNDSARTSSVSTALTAHSEAEDVKTEVAVKIDDASDVTPCAEERGFDLSHGQANATVESQ